MLRDRRSTRTRAAQSKGAIHSLGVHVATAAASLVGAVLIVSCGSTASATVSPTTTPAPTAAPTVAPTPAPTVTPTPTATPILTGYIETGSTSEGDLFLYVVVATNNPAGLSLVAWSTALDGDPATSRVSGSHPSGSRTCIQSFTHDGYAFTVSYFATADPPDDVVMFAGLCAGAPDFLFTDSPGNG